MSNPTEIRRLFEELVDLDPTERTARLDALDPDTRQAVTELLAIHDDDTSFMDVPEPEGPATLPFDSLGGVTILNQFGAGGAGTVYRGHDEATGEVVALKLLLLGLLGSGTNRDRFEREAETMARLEHPSIVRVRRGGIDKGTPYMVMDFVAGSHLALEMDPTMRRGLAPDRDDPKAVASFLADVADALAYAHARDVIHRDVKPANILIERDGRPKLTDFGLARDESFTQSLTRTGDVAGTFGYMSPEQLLGDRPMDARTDVYSLGVVLYEMMSGERPYTGQSSVELARAMDDTVPRRLGKLNDAVPRDLQTICTRAIEREPNDRYGTMAAMAADLRAFARDQPIMAKPPSAVARVRGLVRRRKRVMWVAVAMVVIAAIGVAAGTFVEESTDVLVELASTPPETEVWIRPWDPDTYDYGVAVPLGASGRRVRVEPGLARFVFMHEDGRFAELTREVPTRATLGSEDAFRIEATLRDTASARRSMVSVRAAEFSYPVLVPSPWAGRVDRWRGPGFEIATHEVTIGEFREFVRATGRDPSEFQALALPDSLDDRPVPEIAFVDARAFAEWRGGRLPTAMEFYRAHVGQAMEDASWQWDPDIPENLHELAAVGRRPSTGVDTGSDRFESFARFVPPVGSHPWDRSPIGVFDLVGSMAEFVDQPWVSYDMGDSTQSIRFGQHVAVGASWSMPSFLSQWGSTPIDKSHRGTSYGFRCVRSIDPLGHYERLAIGVAESD